MHSSYPKDVGEALPLASTMAELRQCEQRAVMALRQVSGIGDVGVARLLREHGDAVRALQSLSADRRDSALHEADGILGHFAASAARRSLRGVIGTPRDFWNWPTRRK